MPQGSSEFLTMRAPRCTSLGIFQDPQEQAPIPGEWLGKWILWLILYFFCGTEWHWATTTVMTWWFGIILMKDMWQVHSSGLLKVQQQPLGLNHMCRLMHWFPSIHVLTAVLPPVKSEGDGSRQPLPFVPPTPENQGCHSNSSIGSTRCIRQSCRGGCNYLFWRLLTLLLPNANGSFR